MATSLKSTQGKSYPPQGSPPPQMGARGQVGNRGVGITDTAVTVRPLLKGYRPVSTPRTVRRVVGDMTVPTFNPEEGGVSCINRPSARSCVSSELLRLLGMTEEEYLKEREAGLVDQDEEKGSSGQPDDLILSSPWSSLHSVGGQDKNSPYSDSPVGEGWVRECVQKIEVTSYTPSQAPRPDLEALSGSLSPSEPKFGLGSSVRLKMTLPLNGGSKADSEDTTSPPPSPLSPLSPPSPPASSSLPSPPTPSSLPSPPTPSSPFSPTPSSPFSPTPSSPFSPRREMSKEGSRARDYVRRRGRADLFTTIQNLLRPEVGARNNAELEFLVKSLSEDTEVTELGDGSEGFPGRTGMSASSSMSSLRSEAPLIAPEETILTRMLSLDDPQSALRRLIQEIWSISYRQIAPWDLDRIYYFFREYVLYEYDIPEQADDQLVFLRQALPGYRTPFQAMLPATCNFLSTVINKPMWSRDVFSVLESEEEFEVFLQEEKNKKWMLDFQKVLLETEKLLHQSMYDSQECQTMQHFQYAGQVKACLKDVQYFRKTMEGDGFDMAGELTGVICEDLLMLENRLFGLQRAIELAANNDFRGQKLWIRAVDIMYQAAERAVRGRYHSPKKEQNLKQALEDVRCWKIRNEALAQGHVAYQFMIREVTVKNQEMAGLLQKHNITRDTYEKSIQQVLLDMPAEIHEHRLACLFDEEFHELVVRHTPAGCMRFDDRADDDNPHDISVRDNVHTMSESMVESYLKAAGKITVLLDESGIQGHGWPDQPNGYLDKDGKPVNLEKQMPAAALQLILDKPILEELRQELKDQACLKRLDLKPDEYESDFQLLVAAAGVARDQKLKPRPLPGRDPHIIDYKGKTVPSFCRGDEYHPVNVIITEVFDRGKLACHGHDQVVPSLGSQKQDKDRPVYKVVRMGVPHAYAVPVAGQAREKVTNFRWKEVFATTLLTFFKEKLTGLDTLQSGQEIELPMFYNCLLSPDRVRGKFKKIGGVDDELGWCREMFAQVNAYNNGGSVPVQIYRSDGSSVCVLVKPRIYMFINPCNELAYSPKWSRMGGVWAFADEVNTHQFKRLFGSLDPESEIGGDVGKYLEQPDSEVHPVIQQVLRELVDIIRSMFQDKLHHLLWQEPFFFSMCQMAIGRLMEFGIVIGCKSAKDRTGNYERCDMPFIFWLNKMIDKLIKDYDTGKPVPKRIFPPLDRRMTMAERFNALQFLFCSGQERIQMDNVFKPGFKIPSYMLGFLKEYFPLVDYYMKNISAFEKKVETPTREPSMKPSLSASRFYV